MTIHASCVALGDVGVLILGASGSGKSALSLQLMSLGASLVSDDRTVLDLVDGEILASPPATIAGLIEARGVGVLYAHHIGSVPVRLVVDLNLTETQRLPVARTTRLLEKELPCLHKVEGPHFPAAILQYLKGGRRDPRDAT